MVPFVWSIKYEERFQELKTLLNITLNFSLLVEGKDVIIFYYASLSGLAAVLM